MIHANAIQELLLQRPLDEDTSVHLKEFIEVGSIPVLLEHWSADGVTGHSAVFLVDQVGSMSDEDLRRLLGDAGIDVGDRVTVARRDRWVFLNFGFEVK